MFLEQQIRILECFLDDHVTLKTEFSASLKYIKTVMTIMLFLLFFTIK